MKKHRIVFATGNAGKMKEIRLIMADLGCEVVSMKEAGADPEIVENGRSFAENAEIKARAVWNCTGDIVLADDSGLVVDYIGGCLLYTSPSPRYRSLSRMPSSA